MTTALTSQPVPLAVSRTGQGGGFVGLAWLTWRQHRWMIVVGVLGFGLVTAYLWWLDHEIGRIAALCNGPCSPQSAPGELVGLYASRAGELWGYESSAGVALNMLILASPLVAAFVAAPLVSREYEQRTNLLVWSQDVRAAHWLAAKATLLATVAAVASAVLGFAANGLVHRIHDLPDRRVVFISSLFSNSAFEATPAMQVGYTLFGFALGLAISAVVHRTLPAMGITLAVFFATRIVVFGERPYYMPPLRHVEDGHKISWDKIGDNTLTLSSGYADASGVPLGNPCTRANSSADWNACLHDHGAVNSYVDYQPGSRLGTFHLIEEGIFVVLAAVLFVLAWWRVRRATTIG